MPRAELAVQAEAQVSDPVVRLRDINQLLEVSAVLRLPLAAATVPADPLQAPHPSEPLLARKAPPPDQVDFRMNTKPGGPVLGSEAPLRLDLGDLLAEDRLPVIQLQDRQPLPDLLPDTLAVDLPVLASVEVSVLADSAHPAALADTVLRAVLADLASAPRVVQAVRVVPASVLREAQVDLVSVARAALAALADPVSVEDTEDSAVPVPAKSTRAITQPSRELQAKTTRFSPRSRRHPSAATSSNTLVTTLT